MHTDRLTAIMHPTLRHHKFSIHYQFVREELYGPNYVAVSARVVLEATA